jgi:hypothetical protein
MSVRATAVIDTNFSAVPSINMPSSAAVLHRFIADSVRNCQVFKTSLPTLLPMVHRLFQTAAALCAKKYQAD